MYKDPDYMKKWRAANKKHISEYNRKYRLEHLDEIKARQNYNYNNRTEEQKEQQKAYDKKRNDAYYATQQGRATAIIRTYIKKDRKYNRGECTVTAEDFIRICSNGCYWCGESDWRKLGLDRIDNSKPHTVDNCVCSCKSCNDKRGRLSFEDFKERLTQLTLF